MSAAADEYDEGFGFHHVPVLHVCMLFVCFSHDVAHGGRKQAEMYFFHKHCVLDNEHFGRFGFLSALGVTGGLDHHKEDMSLATLGMTLGLERIMTCPCKGRAMVATPFLQRLEGFGCLHVADGVTVTKRTGLE